MSTEGPGRGFVAAGGVIILAALLVAIVGPAVYSLVCSTVPGRRAGQGCSFATPIIRS